MKVTTNYISCACNCHPHTVDWGKNGLICYASSYSIVIYDPNAGGTGRALETLHKHSSPIKTVQWIQTEGTKPESEILSTSEDGMIICWSKNEDSYKPSFSIEAPDQLTMAQAYYIKKSSENNQPMLLSGAFSSDSIPVWLRTSSKDALIKQELILNKKYPINIQFCSLPDNSSNIPAMIVSTEDYTIHLLAWNMDSDVTPLNFVQVKELKGHQDWVQSLDVLQFNAKEALIASGSQDGMIRLWKLTSIAAEELSDEVPTQFSIGSHRFNASLESVLSGHSHWVYGLHWHPPVLQDGEVMRPLKLLSSALDKTMLIWEPDADGVWVETVKLGKFGGNPVGYYGCRFNEDGSSVLAYGYQGTFHVWRHDKTLNKWLPRSGPSGHFSDVTDIAWEDRGGYLISTSLDQTTRIHVPWRKISGHDRLDDEVWHEVARPQIHGYDINVFAILDSRRFASGADEKVVRIFEAPGHFVEALQSGNWKDPKRIGDRALVPALGLTNKSVDKIQVLEDEDHDEVDTERPPTEEEIIRHTLWPEREKLYGHGYELFSMAATRDGKLLATGCKSSSQEHSAIIIWNTETFAQVQKLVSHRLTVTQLKFSPDDRYLVSVSRDRRWGLYGLDDKVDGEVAYKVITMSTGAKSLHSRIIWCCSWTHDSKYFATGSRDSKIGFWKADEQLANNERGSTASLEIINASITALAFSSRFLDVNTYVLAVGFEDGGIEILKIDDNNPSIGISSCGKLDSCKGHHKTVTKLAFRPETRPEVLQLASCSADRSVKIHTFNVEDILQIVR